jgi:hypothetical protein
MKRSWLIAGVIAAGILVFWLAGDDKPTPSKRAATAPTPIDSYYAAGEASSDTEPAPGAIRSTAPPRSAATTIVR